MIEVLTYFTIIHTIIHRWSIIIINILASWVPSILYSDRLANPCRCSLNQCCSRFLTYKSIQQYKTSNVLTTNSNDSEKYNAYYTKLRCILRLTTEILWIIPHKLAIVLHCTTLHYIPFFLLLYINIAAFIDMYTCV